MEVEEEEVVLEVEAALEVLLIVAHSAIVEVEWELERLATADQSPRVGGAAMGADIQQTAMEWVPWVLVGEEAEAVLATTVDTRTTTTAMGTAVGCLATEWVGTEVG